MAAQTSGKVPYETLTPYGKKRRTLREHRLGYDVDEPDAMDEADDPSTDPMLAVQRATAEERESRQVEGPTAAKNSACGSGSGSVLCALVLPPPI